MLLFQGFTFPNAMCRSKALGKGRPKPTSRRNREKRVTLHTYGQTANADTAPLVEFCFGSEDGVIDDSPGA